MDNETTQSGIKEIRNGTGLSQSEFATKFHLPVSTLQHWEQGVRSAPSYVIWMIERILELEKRIDEIGDMIKRDK